MPERVEVRAVRNGAVDYVEVPTAQETYLAALERELVGYRQRGDAVGAFEVEREIARCVADASVPASDGVRCVNPDCKLMHPHAGPPVLREEKDITNGGSEPQRRGRGRPRTRG